jgi:hypothetical protein
VERVAFAERIFAALTGAGGGPLETDDVTERVDSLNSEQAAKRVAHSPILSAMCRARSSGVSLTLVLEPFGEDRDLVLDVLVGADKDRPRSGKAHTQRWATDNGSCSQRSF